MTVDPFILRGAAVGAAWRADRGGAAGAVYHAVGGGPLPIASGLPVVVTLLDLAPWELPDAFGRTVASRFGQRLRAQILRDAAAVIVGSEATAPRPPGDCSTCGATGCGSSRWRRGPAFARPRDTTGPRSPPAPALRERLGLPERYLVCSGRFDARLDLAPRSTRSRRLAAVGRRRPASGADRSWPPRVLMVGREPGGSGGHRPGRGSAWASARPSRTRRASRRRTWPRWSAAPGPCSCPWSRRRPACRPSRRSPAGRRSSRRPSGRCPEIVGAAGLLVEPGDPDRLAVGLDDDLGRRRRPRHGLAEAAACAGGGGPPDLGRRGARDAGGSTTEVGIRRDAVVVRDGSEGARRRGLSSAWPMARAWPAAGPSRP